MDDQKESSLYVYIYNIYMYICIYVHMYAGQERTEELFQGAGDMINKGKSCSFFSLFYKTGRG